MRDPLHRFNRKPFKSQRACNEGSPDRFTTLFEPQQLGLQRRTRLLSDQALASGCGPALAFADPRQASSSITMPKASNPTPASKLMFMPSERVYICLSPSRPNSARITPNRLNIHPIG